jgi:hypothetical protein
MNGAKIDEFNKHIIFIAFVTHSLIHLPTEIQHPFTTPAESTEPNFVEKEH